MEIISKAFQVWHEGMLNDNPHEGYTMDELPVTYAETAGLAKTMSSEVYDYELYGYEPEFTDLKVRRAKSYDKIMFEGHEYKRWQINTILETRERHSERRKAVEKFPDGTNFYVQNGFVGNSVLWWGKNSNGYTSDISKAELYTKEEILSKFVEGREEDRIWEAKHVLSKVKSHVDGQYLSSEYRA